MQMTLDNARLLLISGGATALYLAVARHMPAPKKDSVYYAWLFDVAQDLAKNNDRIGERRETVSK